MEVLAARFRIGEALWTFDQRHKQALHALQDLGLVRVIHGVVPKTIRASLTKAGRTLYLHEAYVPPNRQLNVRDRLAEATEAGMPTHLAASGGTRHNAARDIADWVVRYGTDLHGIAVIDAT